MFMSVTLGNALSSKNACSNGLKQGGVLSPKFFKVYMNDLSLKFNSNVGCKICSVKIYHLGYADDFCSLAISVITLQMLLNICNTSGSENDVVC